jgi:5'-deoxynucleotidase YfbR-like HD superfamily hydrolase
MQFFLRNPSPCIRLSDIATGLSNQCRYSGQLDEFYSVAQHSVFVMEQVWRNLPQDLDETERRFLLLQAILHDASEAYLVDIPTPIKKTPEMAAYRTLEAEVQDACFRHFGMELHPRDLDPLVKHYDELAAVYERRHLMEQWEESTIPWGEFDKVSEDGAVVLRKDFRDVLYMGPPKPLSPKKARAAFLDAFQQVF